MLSFPSAFIGPGFSFTFPRFQLALSDDVFWAFLRTLLRSISLLNFLLAVRVDNHQCINMNIPSHIFFNSSTTPETTKKFYLKQSVAKIVTVSGNSYTKRMYAFRQCVNFLTHFKNINEILFSLQMGNLKTHAKLQTNNYKSCTHKPFPSSFCIYCDCQAVSQTIQFLPSLPSKNQDCIS
jgi:hypothetical protein